MEKFYSQVLGYGPVEESRQDTWLEFDTGLAKFSLHAIPPHIADQIEISDPPELREDTPFKLLWEAGDLEGELGRLRVLGIPLIQRPWGGWDGVDPEGNIFGIVPARHKP
ncbi:hypothetical protein [Paludibaculum fermentans]|uniref:hypothetical protein n=1 Tax=Paludibaculum fermentans TaxID=1473598 RepID=UPI003EBCC00E